MRKTPLVKGDAMLKSLIILGNDRAEELAAKIATALLLGFLAFGLGHMLSVHYATNGHCDLSSHQDGTFGELRTTAQC